MADHGSILPIAPATHYEHLVKRSDPARQSDRAKRETELRPHIQRVFDDNWRVYGVRKVWRQLRREGFNVARCTVARLMKIMGIQSDPVGLFLQPDKGKFARPINGDEEMERKRRPQPIELMCS